MKFVSFSKRLCEIMCDESSSMRIQYKDDEDTYITMSNKDDFEDALRCITQIKHHENIFRLSIRVDDSLTPKSSAKKKQYMAKDEDKPTPPPRTSTASKRKLIFPTATATVTKSVERTEPIAESKRAETPLQRYISNCQSKINEKRLAKQKLEDDEKNSRTKIQDAKLQNGERGSICHNCHLRLGHTSHTCSFDSCETIYSCGQGKFHPAEQSKLRQLSQSINKLDKDIQQLSIDTGNRKTAVSKIENSMTSRIEAELLEADDESYDKNGFRNWQLLRKHVYAIQGYSKKHLNGKIPPKHELKSILNLALDESSELTDTCKIKHKQSRGRKHRENPFKEQLEREGIIFPSKPNSYDEMCDDDESDLPRYMPTTKEEEEEQLKIALSISAKSYSTDPPAQIQRPCQGIPETMNQYGNHQYPEPQVIQPQSRWFHLPSYMPNIFPYHQTPDFFYPADMESYGSRSSTVGASSTCTITSLQPAQDCNNTEGQVNALPNVERAEDNTVASNAAEVLLQLYSSSTTANANPWQ